jgi:hypothetical protein
MKIEPTNWLTTAIVKFLARVTPRCHDMTRLISQSQEEPLPPGTRLKMRLHYVICVWCERYRDQIALLRKALPRCEEHIPPSRTPPLSESAKDRLKKALKDSA